MTVMPLHIVHPKAKKSRPSALPTRVCIHRRRVYIYICEPLLRSCLSACHAPVIGAVLDLDRGGATVMCQHILQIVCHLRGNILRTQHMSGSFQGRGHGGHCSLHCQMQCAQWSQLWAIRQGI